MVFLTHFEEIKQKQNKKEEFSLLYNKLYNNFDNFIDKNIVFKNFDNSHKNIIKEAFEIFKPTFRTLVDCFQ